MTTITRHISAYVTGGVAAGIVMIMLSLFTTLTPLAIGLGALLTVWMPVYGLLVKAMEG